MRAFTYALCLAVLFISMPVSANTTYMVVDRVGFPVGDYPFQIYAEIKKKWYLARGIQPGHNGEDWNLRSGPTHDNGADIYAIANGVVVESRIFNDCPKGTYNTKGVGCWGSLIVIRHRAPYGKHFYYNGKKYACIYSLYSHMDRKNVFVKKGAKVYGGELIGKVGTADGYYSPHLHFEVRTTYSPTLTKGYFLPKNPVAPTQFILANLTLRSGALNCHDCDGDGFGFGVRCRGFDCDDTNHSRQSCRPGCVDRDKDGRGVGDGCKTTDDCNDNPNDPKAKLQRSGCIVNTSSLAPKNTKEDTCQLSYAHRCYVQKCTYTKAPKCLDNVVRSYCYCDPKFGCKKGTTKLCRASYDCGQPEGRQACDSSGRWDKCSARCGIKKPYINSISPTTFSLNGKDQFFTVTVLGSNLEKQKGGNVRLWFSNNGVQITSIHWTSLNKILVRIKIHYNAKASKGYLLFKNSDQASAQYDSRRENGSKVFLELKDNVPVIPRCVDRDKDGYGIGNGCGGLKDCDDNNPAINPGAKEICNSHDDNCDGRIDSIQVDCQTACGKGKKTCTEGKWSSCSAPAPQPEVCDQKDNDCDGKTDEGCACVPGQVRPCGSNTGICRSGYQLCSKTGQWGNCNLKQGPSTEVCDGLDNDCDGKTDESLTKTCRTACGSGTQTCQKGVWTPCNAPKPQKEICDGKDNDCDGSVDLGVTRACKTACGHSFETCVRGVWQGCNAPKPQTETCDNRDNDCDGLVDENISRSCSTQCGKGTQTCQKGSWTVCNGPLPKSEFCDGKDNDCDGLVDEVPPRPCSTKCENGFRTCAKGIWSLCSARLPSSEICDGKDNDCDGSIDEQIVRSCKNTCGNFGVETCSHGKWGTCNASKCSTSPPSCSKPTHALSQCLKPYSRLALKNSICGYTTQALKIIVTQGSQIKTYCTPSLSGASQEVLYELYRYESGINWHQARAQSYICTSCTSGASCVKSQSLTLNYAASSCP